MDSDSKLEMVSVCSCMTYVQSTYLWCRDRGRGRGRLGLGLLRLAQGPPHAYTRAMLSFGEVVPGVLEVTIGASHNDLGAWKFRSWSRQYRNKFLHFALVPLPFELEPNVGVFGRVPLERAVRIRGQCCVRWHAGGFVVVLARGLAH